MFIPSYFSGRLFRRYLRMADHPFKIRIQHIAGKRIFAKGITVQNASGVKFRLDPNDWITRIILKTGDYENDSVKLAGKLLQNGGVFIDIGANFGLFTCQVAAVSKLTHVIAIEPNYRIVGPLLYNININDLQNRVQVFNLAVSDGVHLVGLEQPVVENMGTTMISEQTGTLNVLSCSLDFICGQMKSAEVELIKIDIEGNEFTVFKDFDFSKYTVKNIILEYNENAKIQLPQLIAFFNSKGYACADVSGIPVNAGNPSLIDNNIWFFIK